MHTDATSTRKSTNGYQIQTVANNKDLPSGGQAADLTKSTLDVISINTKNVSGSTAYLVYSELAGK